MVLYPFTLHGQIVVVVCLMVKFYAFKVKVLVVNLPVKKGSGAFSWTVNVYAENQQHVLVATNNSFALIIVVHFHATTKFHALLVLVAQYAVTNLDANLAAAKHLQTLTQKLTPMSKSWTQFHKQMLVMGHQSKLSQNVKENESHGVVPKEIIALQYMCPCVYIYICNVYRKQD